MRSTLLRASLRALGPGVLAACAALALWTAQHRSEPLVQHDAGEYRFLYPARWTLTHDTFDLDTSDSRVVALRAPDGVVVMLHSFAPASHLSAEEFADELARQRRSVIAELGVQGGDVQRQLPEQMRVDGMLCEGVRQEFELASGGLHFAQVARVVRVELAEQELFVSVQSPAHSASSAQQALALVLASLQANGSRLASAAPRRTP